MDQFEEWKELPGTEAEKRWIRDRLETLSVKEGIALSAAGMRISPHTAAQAINHLLSLEDYEICSPAGSYRALGVFYLRHGGLDVSKQLYPYMDLEKLGWQFEEEHPGLFIGDCYAVYPPEENLHRYDGAKLPEDGGWSLKLKLSSEKVPEGVWVRLPDYEELNDGKPDEIRLALDALRVQTIQECTLLETRYILPQIDPLDEYGDLADLIYDGQNLGFLLDEQGQGTPHFYERFQAALELENCQSLKDALEIGQNLFCYDFIPATQTGQRALAHLQKSGFLRDERLLDCFDLEGYTAWWLESEGYLLSRNGGGFVRRNERPFFHDPAREAPGLSMG